MRILKLSLAVFGMMSWVGCSSDQQDLAEQVSSENAVGATGNVENAAGNSTVEGNVSAITDAAAPANGQNQSANPAIAANAAGWSTLYVTGTQKLRVRNAPSVDAPVVRLINEGEAVQNVGTVRTWIKLSENEFASAKHLRNSNGQLALDFINSMNTASPTNAEATATTQFKVANTEFLRVRSAPNNTAAVTRTLASGTEVQAINRLPGGWIQIGNNEYVHNSFLAPTELSH